MAQTRAITLYHGSGASPVVDFTDDTDWPSTELSGLAAAADASAGSWLVRDEVGGIPDYVTNKFLNAHNVVVATVGSNTLFRGRLAATDHFRGRQKAGRASEWTVTLEDNNSQLRGIIVHNWVRPAETDVARALALASTYLNGSPRATTVLSTSLIITGSNTIALPAKTYSGVTPYEIMQELAANGDKETFVSVDNELALFGHDYAGYSSLLRISDDPADQNATTWAPWDPHSNETERNQLSALRVYWGASAVQQTIELTAPAVALIADYWEDVFFDSQSTTAAQAQALAQKLLDWRAVSDTSDTCSIGPMTGDEIWKIKPGHLIQYKARAARGGRPSAGVFAGDSFTTLRVREVRWTMPAEDEYIARLELDRPRRVSAPGRGSQSLVQSGGSAVGAQLEIAYLRWTFTNPPNMPQADDLLGTYITGLERVTPQPGFYGPADSAFGVGYGRNTSGEAVNHNDIPVIPGLTYYFVLDVLWAPDGSFSNRDIWMHVMPMGTDFYLAHETGHAMDTKYTIHANFVAPVGAQYMVFFTTAQGTVYFDNIYMTYAAPAIVGSEFGPYLVAIADGATSTWTTVYPYAAGTLNVMVDGVPQTVIEVNPGARIFQLPWTPSAGDQISANFQVA